MHRLGYHRRGARSTRKVGPKKERTIRRERSPRDKWSRIEKRIQKFCYWFQHRCVILAADKQHLSTIDLATCFSNRKYQDPMSLNKGFNLHGRYNFVFVLCYLEIDTLIVPFTLFDSNARILKLTLSLCHSHSFTLTLWCLHCSLLIYI